MQNFRAKPGTRMADHPDATLEEQLWTIAAARIVLGGRLARAGAAESRLRRLPAPPRRRNRRLGRRLAGHGRSREPRGAVARDRALARGDCVARARTLASPAVVSRARRRPGSLGRPGGAAACAPCRGRARSRREDRWAPGAPVEVPFIVRRDAIPLELTGEELGPVELERLFRARGIERERVFAAADRLRREVCGDEVTYVVTRNIQYTNVCYFRCGFCAFSKGKLAANLRGPAFLVPMDEIVRRSLEAWERGATEVCLQGGIHPSFTGDYYADVVVLDSRGGAGPARPCILGARDLAGRRDAGPLARRLSRPLARTSVSARLPGTAAEILDDEMRAVICPDKVSTDQWLEVHARGPSSRASFERDDDDGSRRAAGALGEPSRPGARATGAQRWFHRVRATAVRADGGADVPQGARPPRPDVRRGVARTRRGPARARIR